VKLLDRFTSKSPTEAKPAPEAQARGLFGDTVRVDPNSPTVSSSSLHYDTAGEQLESYVKAVWIFACVHRIATLGSIIPFEIQDSNGNVVDSFPLSELLEAPNEDDAFIDILRRTIADRVLTGNAYWFKEMAGARLESLKPISPGRCRPVPGTEELIKNYKYTVNGRDTYLEKDKVIHFRGYNPENRYEGASPMQSLGLSVEMQNELMTWNADYFRKGVVADTFFSAPGELSDTAYKRLKRWLDSTLTGSRNNRKPALLEGGLTAQFPSNLPKDMGFRDLSEETRLQIFASLGVPPFIMGFTGDANRSNSKEQKEVFYSYTLNPILGDIARVINRHLFMQYAPGYEIHFTVQRVLQELSETPEERERRLIASVQSGVRTVDEARAEIGLDPLGQPSPQEEGKSFIVGVAGHYKKASTDLIEGASRIIPPIERGIKAVWDAQEDYLLRRIAEISERDYQSLIKTVKEFGFADVAEVFGEWNWGEEWGKNTIGELTAAVRLGINIGLNEIPRPATVPEGLIDANVARLSSHITLVDDYTREQTAKTILDGLRDGKTLNDIRTDIRKNFHRWRGYSVPGEELPKISMHRARTIAQTEAFSGYNVGKRSVWQEFDTRNEYRKEWVALFVNTRETHALAHGQEQRHDVPFDVGGAQLMQPHDPAGPPGEIINCQCTITHKRAR
jgi:HK97 family phage portal protein